MATKERQRLQRLFGALVLTLGSAQACRMAATPGETPDGGEPPTPDATAGTDGGGVLSDGDAALGRDCISSLTARDAGPDGDAADLGCSIFLPCGIPTGLTNSGCELYYTEPVTEPLDARDMYCHVIEGQGCSDGVYTPPPTGITIACFDCSGGGGRSSSGIAPAPACSQPSLGAYFAHMAHEEAASVYSFTRLYGELLHHRAPRALLRAARRAARDEVRHAALMASRARALGCEPPVPNIRVARRKRSLETIAAENAVEGCLRETFGALLATWQSRHASNPSVRRLYATIARDETGHAALAWDVARWIDRRLSPRSRARVNAARKAAEVTLVRTVRRSKALAFRGELGLPDAGTAACLLQRMVAGV